MNDPNYDALRAELHRRLTNPVALRRPDRIHITNAAEIVWTAQHGPRSTAVAQAILATPSLSRMLKDEWDANPPSPELRHQLQQDPYGKSLLSLIPEAPAVRDAAKTPGREWVSRSLSQLSDVLRAALIPMTDVAVNHRGSATTQSTYRAVLGDYAMEITKPPTGTGSLAIHLPPMDTLPEDPCLVILWSNSTVTLAAVGQDTPRPLLTQPPEDLDVYPVAVAVLRAGEIARTDLLEEP